MSTSNQLELFENEINSSTSLQKLEIEYVKDFFNKTESDILFHLNYLGSKAIFKIFWIISSLRESGCTS